MKHYFNFRQWNVLGGIACLLVLSTAYFIEYGFNQIPCSLCLLQRYVLWLLCLSFLIAALHAPKGLFTRVAYGLLNVLLSGIGFLLTLRQIWIQHLPKEAAPNCVADLERILQYQPLLEAVQTILTGGGECREAKFTLLGLSLAEISTVVFAGFMLFSIVLVISQKKRRNL